MAQASTIEWTSATWNPITPLALRILDQVEQVIRDELKRLGVTP